MTTHILYLGLSLVLTPTNHRNPENENTQKIYTFQPPQSSPHNSDTLHVTPSASVYPRDSGSGSGRILGVLISRDCMGSLSECVVDLVRVLYKRLKQNNFLASNTQGRSSRLHFTTLQIHRLNAANFRL